VWLQARGSAQPGGTDAHVAAGRALQLRDDPATTSIPVVIHSADATPGQVQRLLSAGASAYLTKPFDVRELLAIIDDIVTG